MAYIHLAGGENELTKLVESGTDAILVSYFYVRKHKQEVIRALAPLAEDIKSGKVHVILDSGAFSFFGKKHVDLVDLEGYLFEYINFIREYHYLFTACVELDVGAIVGQDVVEQWREFVFGLLTKDIPDLYVIYVWHKDDGWSAWTEMCKKYPYVGVGSDNKTNMDLYKKMLNVAKKYGSKVHGFAITRKDPIRNLPFYSVDSTTWIMGGKYGATFFFSGSDLVRIDDDKTSRRRWKSKYVRLGFNWNAIEADVREEVNKINAFAWVEYSQWLDKKRKMKVYWRTDCAGKIRAAFDNTHHDQNLTKSKQMKIKWGEEEWRQVVEAANPGNWVPGINPAQGEGGTQEPRKKRGPKPAEEAEVQRASKARSVTKEASRVQDSLEQQEDWSNGDPLLEKARRHVQERIEEMEVVAPELIEKTRRIAKMYNDNDEKDQETSAPQRKRSRLRKPERTVRATVRRSEHDESEREGDDRTGAGILAADSDVERDDNGSGTALVPVVAKPSELALSLDDRSLQEQIALEQGGVLDALDEEDLARILPVRDEESGLIEDEHGDKKLTAFSKAERKLAAKKILGGLAKGNAMMCNTCFVSDQCPMYQRNSTCFFTDQVGLNDRRLTDRELSSAQTMIARQMFQRAQMMLLMEQMNGGYEDKNATKLLQIAFDMMEKTKDVAAEAQFSRLVGAQAAAVEAEQSRLEDMDAQEQPQQSVLAQLFGLGPQQAVTHTDDDFEEVEGATDAEFEEITGD